jgi:hypothetical protein
MFAVDALEPWSLSFSLMYMHRHHRTDICSCYRTKNRSISVELGGQRTGLLQGAVGAHVPGIIDIHDRRMRLRSATLYIIRCRCIKPSLCEVLKSPTIYHIFSALF